MTGRTFLRPDILFVLLAALGGLVLVALIPPMGGGNEQMNFRRAASIASGQMAVKPTPLPGGLADFLKISDSIFREGRQPPISYSREEFAMVAGLPLRPDQPKIVNPSAIAVLHPLSYLPQASTIALGLALGASPLTLFYLGRLAGLAAGILLTFLAIRIIPIHKYALAAMALLPTILFSRSTLDADQLTVGLAFLFFALAIREIAAKGQIKTSVLAGLAISAFLLAQCKSAYLLLPLLTIAIPEERFQSRRARLLALALIILPGIVGSLAWMIMLKQSYFHGLGYRTWSGLVLPDQQLNFIVSQPLSFLAVLARTIFTTALIPKALVEFLGVFGPPVTMPIAFFPVLVVLIAGVTLSGEHRLPSLLEAWRLRVFAIALALVTTIVILTLLYLQWTRFQGPVVQGFQGRYLYPLTPLLLMAIPSSGKAVFGLSPAYWLLLVGIVSLGGTWWVTWTTYLA